MKTQEKLRKYAFMCKFLYALPIIALPIASAMFSQSASANGRNHALARITEVVGAPSMSSRINGQTVPVGRGSELGKFPDTLLLPEGINSAAARLDFYTAADQHAGTAVQARTKNNQHTYYSFPCRLEGGSFVIQWENAGIARGCETGFRVDSSSTQNSYIPKTETLFAFHWSKQIKIPQITGPRYQNYCSVSNSTGQGWLGVTTSGDPCQEPLQACQQSSGENCTVATLDRWVTRETELTAIVSCANNQTFEAKATGSEMPGVVNQLWQQVQSQGVISCAMHVINPNESIVVPPSDSEEVLVEIQNDPSCSEFSISNGNVKVRTAENPDGVAVTQGQKYTYCGNSSADSFDSFDTSVESIDLQLFHASERGHEFCGRAQNSGGQKGDRQIVQLTSNEGEIRIDYDMKAAEDRLEVIYEGQTIIDTGFVSNQGTVSALFQGNSGQVEVVVTGNQDVSDTAWDYTLYCP